MSIQELPCGASPDCLHVPCRGCERPLLQGHDSTVDHPGTRAHRHSYLCTPCVKQTGALTKEDLKDQRHILLSNKEMTRLYHDFPDMFAWHVSRRKRIKARPPKIDTRVCAIEGCEGRIRARDLCLTHYTRQYRHGDPLVNLNEQNA